MLDSILSHLTAAPWRDTIQYFDTITSTNDVLKELAAQGAPEGTTLIAGSQSGGRGRLGRTFLSPPETGIYMSVLLRPNCSPLELMHLTCAVAAAMCRAVECAAGLRPGIKWTNDLVWGKQKFAGILTEMGLNAAGGVDWAIVGIGVNCCQRADDFPPEIRDRACSLAMAAGREIDRCRVAAAMMEALWEMDASLFTGKKDMLRFYRENCVTLGKEISVVGAGEVRHGRALDVDDEGALVVEFPDSHVEAVNAGEVSIRGMYGYI